VEPMQEMLNKSQQARETAQQLLPNYSSDIQSSWNQLQQVGHDVLGGQLPFYQVYPRAQQIYSNLSSEDKQSFKDLFQQVYGYSFDNIIGHVWDWMTNGNWNNNWNANWNGMNRNGNIRGNNWGTGNDNGDM
uniref:Uncharacterized protein n=1 Tax=Panagrolaimus sp. JU765 TaxID=591449 RepID=A0AC34R5I5_9BILA